MPIVLVTDANPGTATWEDIYAARAADGYSMPASVVVTGPLNVVANTAFTTVDTATLTLPTLADGQTAIYDIDTTFRQTSANVIANEFNYQYRIGTAPGGNILYALEPFKINPTADQASPGYRYHNMSRIAIRREGAALVVDATTRSIQPDTVNYPPQRPAYWSYVGENGDGGALAGQTPIQNAAWTNGGPLVIELEACFNTAGAPGPGPDEMTFTQFCVTRIR